MAIDLRERAPVTRVTEPITLPARRAKLHDLAARLLVAVLAGIAVGAITHSLVTAEDESARIARIQGSRAEHMVQAYEQAWMSVQPTASRILVTGTGPGLAWVAEQQAAWAENAITGTGPGLVTVAQLQAGYEPGSAPTGTGPGLEHLPEQAGPEAAMIGTP